LQIPAELNGVKYLMSLSQGLLDMTGASDSMRFLEQDSLENAHNPSANRKVD
jgi:hypothetical protein